MYFFLISLFWFPLQFPLYRLVNLLFLGSKINIVLLHYKVPLREDDFFFTKSFWWDLSKSCISISPWCDYIAILLSQIAIKPYY